MVSSLQHMYLNVEIFRLAKHAHRGIDTSSEKWVMDEIKRVGPGGNYLTELSTLESIRNGEWYLPKLGTHIEFERWATGENGDVLSEIREKVDGILKAYEPLPLGEDVEKELEKICRKAREE